MSRPNTCRRVFENDAMLGFCVKALRHGQRYIRVRLAVLYFITRDNGLEALQERYLIQQPGGFPPLC